MDCSCLKFQQSRSGCRPLAQPVLRLLRYFNVMEAWIQHLLELLALPQYGLSTVFVVSFISATLLPLGSEPVVFGLVKLNPSLFWQVYWLPPPATRSVAP